MAETVIVLLIIAVATYKKRDSFVEEVERNFKKNYWGLK